MNIGRYGQLNIGRYGQLNIGRYGQLNIGRYRTFSRNHVFADIVHYIKLSDTFLR